MTEESAEFCLTGQFLAFVVDRGKLKYLRMSVSENEIQIKLSKQVRAALFRCVEQSSVLRPLETIRVMGTKEIYAETGAFKLTAQHILRIEQPEKSVKKNKSSFRLVVCNKSKCQRQGGRQQHRELEIALRDRGLDTTIEQSNCLGKCSMAPNVMLMPGKKRLSGMEPNAIADLLKSLT